MVNRLMLPDDLESPEKSEQIRRLVPNYDGKYLVEEIVEWFRPGHEFIAKMERSIRVTPSQRRRLIGATA